MKNIIIVLLLWVTTCQIECNAKTNNLPSYIEISNPSTGEVSYKFYYYNQNKDVYRIDVFKGADICINDTVVSIRLLETKDTFDYNKSNEMINHKVSITHLLVGLTREG